MVVSGPPPALDLDDIQGHVLRGYRFDHALYAFLHVADAEPGRRWLGSLVDGVTDARPWASGAPSDILNLSVTYRGLEALGVPASLLRTFPDDFRQGMAARAARLGDVGDAAPSRWKEGLGTGDAHVMVELHARSAEAVDEARDRLVDGAAHAGLSVVHEQRASPLDFGREHFGFSDGFSQPAIEGSDRDPRGEGVPLSRGRWRLIRAGEFILGYEDEDGTLPAAPDPPWGRNGTFTVYRRLRQDVAAFRRFLRAEARDFPGGEQLLAAKVVGRWQDGTPLVALERGLDDGNPRDLLNDFRYARDPLGERCPRGAHIRRVNPRDALGFGGELTRRHRMIRRGMPYGEPLPDGAMDDDGVDRGLLFICHVASIERQFEFVQANWCNDGESLGLGDDADLLVASARRSRTMTIQGRPPRFLDPQQTFVTMTGGEYLFRPGIAALRSLTA